MLTPAQRAVLLDGIARGMNLVNGLHEFLNDDAEFAAAALIAGVTITDVRRTKDRKDLQLFTGRIFDVTCPRIAVLGTDGAIGKRTTTTLLVAGAQRPRHQGRHGRHGSDRAHPGRRTASRSTRPCPVLLRRGRGTVVAAFEGEDPDVIVVEGQGALSHPAYLTSALILRGSRPDGVIVQHAPARRMLGDFPTCRCRRWRARSH